LYLRSLDASFGNQSINIQQIIFFPHTLSFNIMLELPFFSKNLDSRLYSIQLAQEKEINYQAK
jgi:hypothetical protein